MSEYQYYEFRALDRRLTAEQQRRLRSLSSRAEISATRFTNEYSFGDFRGDSGRLLEEYFDAYLYAANWGTRELAFRLPGALLDADTARRYCDEEYRAWVTETADHVIVRFRWDDDEGDDWIEAQGLLDPLLGARGGAQVEALLVQRFRREARPADTAAASAGRTASGLLAGAEVRRAARKEAEARARQEARERRAAEQAAAYDRHLETLAGRKDEAWQQVEKLTVLSKPKEFDQATQLLKDLHVIARGEDDIAAFTAGTRIAHAVRQAARPRRRHAPATPTWRHEQGPRSTRGKSGGYGRLVPDPFPGTGSSGWVPGRAVRSAASVLKNQGHQPERWPGSPRPRPAPAFVRSR